MSKIIKETEIYNESLFVNGGAEKKVNRMSLAAVDYDYALKFREQTGDLKYKDTDKQFTLELTKRELYDLALGLEKCNKAIVSAQFKIREEHSSKAIADMMLITKNRKGIRLVDLLKVEGESRTQKTYLKIYDFSAKEWKDITQMHKDKKYPSEYEEFNIELPMFSATTNYVMKSVGIVESLIAQMKNAYLGNGMPMSMHFDKMLEKDNTEAYVESSSTSAAPKAAAPASDSFEEDEFPF